jgi:hypothetical protein
MQNGHKKGAISNLKRADAKPVAFPFGVPRCLVTRKRRSQQLQEAGKRASRQAAKIFSQTMDNFAFIRNKPVPRSRRCHAIPL